MIGNDDAATVPTREAVHEGRKRVKCPWYSTRTQRFIWPAPMGEQADEIHELWDDLADDHDLAELELMTEDRASLIEDDVVRDGISDLRRRQRKESESRVPAREIRIC